MPFALRKRVPLSAFCTATISIERSALFAVAGKLAWCSLAFVGDSARKQLLIKLALT
jgi:hypothetical protein